MEGLGFGDEGGMEGCKVFGIHPARCCKKYA